MRLKQYQLKNFKRFTSLIIKDIPVNAKLVLVIGGNGSGKSSLFDGFEHIARQNGKSTPGIPDNRKDTTQILQEIIIETYEYGKEGVYNQSMNRSGKLTNKSFYGRSSLRQVPRLQKNALGARFNISTDEDRPQTFSDRDLRFENDLEHVLGKLLKEFFVSDLDNQSIKDSVIKPINEAFSRIFKKDDQQTDLILIKMIPPLEGKTAEIVFKKGKNEFHYDKLSAGEKEIFNILLNLTARIDLYQDTLFFFDELDLHLNTQIQFNFLKELVENWIPENCQLWTATHSLGFIEYARQNDEAVIIDLQSLNFDFEQILTPQPKVDSNIYEVAISKEMLANIFNQSNLYFVENKDKLYYANTSLNNAIFISENNRNNVYHKVRTTGYKGIVDRDFLSDEDIISIQAAYINLYILKYYSIENYLYHPENLEEYNSKLGHTFDKELYIQNLISAKNAVKDNIIPNLSLKGLNIHISVNRNIMGRNYKKDSKTNKQIQNSHQKLVHIYKVTNSRFSTNRFQ